MCSLWPSPGSITTVFHAIGAAFPDFKFGKKSIRASLSTVFGVALKPDQDFDLAFAGSDFGFIVETFFALQSVSLSGCSYFKSCPPRIFSLCEGFLFARALHPYVDPSSSRRMRISLL